MITIYWENLGANMLTIKDDTEYRLYAGFDEHEWAHIYLEVDGQKYETCWSNDYWQGREHTPLDSYHIIEFYNAVVRRVYELLSRGNVEFLDLVELQNQLLEEHWWNYWKTNGIVFDEHW